MLNRAKSSVRRPRCIDWAVWASSWAVGLSAHAALPIEHWTQPSGAQVWLVQSHALPMVDVQIDFDGGSRRDPAAQAGLAAATAAQFGKGVQAVVQGQPQPQRTRPGDAQAPRRAAGQPLPPPLRPQGPADAQAAARHTAASMDGPPAAQSAARPGAAGTGMGASATRPALDENQISAAWADLGASFGAAAGTDRLSLSLRSLTDAQLLPRALALAAQQLAAPAFDAALWQRDRARWQAALKESRTRPDTIASEAFERAVYAGHPYGYEVTDATLNAITPADLHAFYRATVRRCAARVSIVGAVSRAQADALATQLLAGLPADGAGADASNTAAAQAGTAPQTATATATSTSAPSPTPVTHAAAGQRDAPPASTASAAPCPPAAALPEVAPLDAAQTLHLPMPLAQAHVLIGQPGYKRSDPEFFELLVGNHILGGGGFTSRLMDAVRQQRGLSYSVYSAFAPGLHAGAFTVGLQTRPDQAALATGVAQDVVARFVANGPTEAELQAAQNFLVGSFALRIDSNRKLLDNVANIAWNNLPLTYLDTWPARVQAVTTQGIRQAFTRVLQPGRMVTVVVGGPP